MIEMQGIMTINEYVKAAIREEEVTASTEDVADAQSNITFDTSEFEERIKEEDEIKKNLRMARTFTRFCMRKATAMKDGNNPLGKKLASEFQSCAELLSGAIIDVIDKQDDGELLTSKVELKKIIN
jgi:hypothetical protein